VRGGINLVSQLSDEERRRGVIAASTGNHGQSVAYAARLFGVQATIVVPEDANPGKVEAMRGLGAKIVFHGRDFDQARQHCEALAAQRGYRYIHSGNEPLLIAGVATETLEVLEDQPDIEVIIVPIGGGSGAAGACIAAKAINPAIQVIGVQAEKAPAAYRSWKERRLVEARMETAAEGLATRTAFALPQSILGRLRAGERGGDLPGHRPLSGEDPQPGRRCRGSALGGGPEDAGAVAGAQGGAHPQRGQLKTGAIEGSAILLLQQHGSRIDN